MTTSTVELEVPGATRITVTDDALTAELADGRRISVPLVWYSEAGPCDGRRKEQLETLRRQSAHSLGRPGRRH